MASNINANNIDGTYPVAGVDNDSQGFRTNFTNIKNNFAYAKSEISDLQAKALLKSALTGTTLDNNLTGALLSGAEFRDFRETRYDHGTTSGTIILNHTNAHYQQVVTNGTIGLAFSNLPAAGKVGRIRLEITVSNTAHYLELTNAVTIGLVGLSGYNSSSNRIEYSEVGTYLYEFTTDDAGTNIIIQDLLRPRDYFYSQQIRLEPRVITDARGQTDDIEGMIAVDTTTPAIWACTTNYDGTTLIWRKVELETRANEATLTNDVNTTSSSLSNIGLSFVAEPNVRYKFDAFMPFNHSDSSVSTHSFTVVFDQGIGYAAIQQQVSPGAVPNCITISTSGDLSTATTTSANIKLCKIEGTYYNASSGRENVRIRFATSAGTLTVKAGAYLRFNRI
jgi:hypothetical protein